VAKHRPADAATRHLHVGNLERHPDGESEVGEVQVVGRPAPGDRRPDSQSGGSSGAGP
jgi:hypothetical protein